MNVQESGVAVGWPLNLGHNTTGWPLGLRLRLMHEDLQWPTMSEQVAFSMSGVSTNSSSLDTTSTKSFFQDKSMTLGALMGLPILDTAGNRHQRFQQRQHRTFLSATAPSNTPAVGPMQTGNRTAKSRFIPHRHRLGRSVVHHHQLQHQLSSRSTVRGSPSAASLAGWCLLSLLSCARVPARIGSPETEAGETMIPRAQLAARQVHPSSTVQDSELELQENHEGPGPPPPPMISQHHPSSLARKLYDNITFEDEELEMSTTRNSNNELSSDGSKEWNPLFSSSPQVARDDEEYDLVNDESLERSGRPMAAPCDHSFELLASCNTPPPVTLMRTSGKDSDALLYIRKDVDSKLRIRCSTSTTFCINVRQWQQEKQQKQHDQLSQEMCEALVDPLIDQNSGFTSGPASDSPRNKILSAFISRMVCCLSTPTRGSSIS